MLLEAGKAARHRVAAGVDDLCIRQDQTDKAHMHEVVGHLVDEKRLVGFALNARAFDIFGAKILKLLLAQIKNSLGIG